MTRRLVTPRSRSRSSSRRSRAPVAARPVDAQVHPLPEIGPDEVMGLAGQGEPAVRDRHERGVRWSGRERISGPG
ncbi:MAG: hypothetical protein M0C28_06340 [Candidatus Moduliflexus flocculans]|nr:hypothetical protein [Candidatus Moduliflexus flocculans]